MIKTMHVGTKLIMAAAMTRYEYNDYRGRDLPADEDGEDEGYLVECTDGGPSNHPNHTGYISWSPELVFNQAYKASGNLTFGHALEVMKSGGRVCRSGWNGKAMWVALTGGSLFDAAHAKYGHAAWYLAQEIKATASDPAEENVILNSHIDMRCADGTLCVGWLASQADMLAEDWCVVDWSETDAER